MSPRQISRRTIDRINSIGPEAAALITDAVEYRLVRQFRRRMLALPPGCQITDGWLDICNFVTVTTSIPYGSDDVDDGLADAHSHLTILCIRVVEELSKAGWLKQRHSAWPEIEFLRTGKLDDVDDHDISPLLSAAERKNAIRKFSSALVPRARTGRMDHG